jgi:hypothetical protein
MSDRPPRRNRPNQNQSRSLAAIGTLPNRRPNRNRRFPIRNREVRRLYPHIYGLKDPRNLRNLCCFKPKPYVWQLNPKTNKFVPFRVYKRRERQRYPIINDKCCCINRKLAFGNRVYETY